MAQNKKTPLLSLCIPTYNRAEYLKECLDSIVSQFKDKNIFKQVEIIISDNNSQDHTEKVVINYQKKYPNIRYFKNKKNIGSIKNVIRAISYTRGAYIWFFADDDLHKEKSLQTVLWVIKTYEPEVILCNLDLYSNSKKGLIDYNLLRVDQDIYLKSKKELFSFLESKFFLPLDWYITCYSNTIIKYKLFNANKKILTTFNKPSNIFPHSSLVYYSPDDYRIYIIAESICNFRSDNRSFGPKNELEFLTYWYSALNIHNNNILTINRKNVSIKFVFLLALKNFTRSLRLVFLKFFRFDISNILIKIHSRLYFLIF